MKKTAKLLCVLLTLVMLIGAIPASAKTKATEIDEYISASFDVYNVPIVDSTIEFQKGINDGLIKPAIADNTQGKTYYTIEAQKTGCILVKSSQRFDVYNMSKTEPEKMISYVKATDSFNTQVFPIRKGDKIAFAKFTDDLKKDLTMYIGFIPEEKIFHVDESTKNQNKTLTFTFGNIYGQDTKLSVWASPKSYSTKDILYDITTNTWNGVANHLSYEYTSIDEEGNAVLTLPESGNYTLYIRLTCSYAMAHPDVNIYGSVDDPVIACVSINLDTDKYITPTLDKLTAPISAVKGTNIIVGYAEPSATVYVEYNGNKYSWKADRNGIYRIVLDEDMKEGKPFKIWQKKGNLTSKKAKYRVTDNV